MAGSVGDQTITHHGEVAILRKSLLPTSTCTPPPLSTTALGHGELFIQQCRFGRSRAPALIGPAGAEERGEKTEEGKQGTIAESLATCHPVKEMGAKGERKLINNSN